MSSPARGYVAVRRDRDWYSEKSINPRRYLQNRTPCRFVRSGNSQALTNLGWLASRRTFALRRAMPATGGRAYLPSARVLCLPSGAGDITLLAPLGQRVLLGHVGQVQGRVEIAIDHQAAGRTGQDALGQGQLDSHCPAVRTDLRRGEETVGGDQQAAVRPGGLVLQLLEHRAPADVGNVAREPPVGLHPAYVEGLHADHTELARQIGVRPCACSRRRFATLACRRRRRDSVRSMRFDLTQ